MVGMSTGHFKVTRKGNYPGISSKDDMTSLAIRLDTKNLWCGIP